MRKGRNIADLMALLFCFLCLPTQGEAFFSLGSISPTLERMANYGYYMMGYAPTPYGYDHEIELYEKEPLWDGHIDVGKVVSPILSALSSQTEGLFGDSGYYGDRERVVKGFDNRLGVRVAVPYVGDFQITREIGPGRFLDKLGPGKYPYSHLSSKGGNKGHHGYGHNDLKGHGGYGYSSTPPKVVYVQKEPSYTKSMYKGLQNYPWYYR